MQKTAITTRQSFFLAMPLLIIMAHFVLVPLSLRWAGRDAWIGAVAGIILGIVIFLAMGRLQERLYGKTLIELMLERLGPWLGRLAALPLILYFFILSVITLYVFSTFISSIFLDTHPEWLITLTFAMVLLFMVHKGIEVIARVSEWILLYNIVSGMLVSLSLDDKKHYDKLLPMLENGLSPVIPVTILILAVFGELIVMLMVHVRKPGPNSYSHTRCYFILFLANLMIIPSTLTGPVAIFGVDQARLQSFPVESMVRLISVGFIERFDIYGLTIMTVSALLRLALLHYATSVAVAQWFSLKDYRWMNVIVGIALIAAALIMFDNYLELLKFLGKYYPYGIISSGAILLLWMITSLVNRSKAGKAGQASNAAKKGN